MHQKCNLIPSRFTDSNNTSHKKRYPKFLFKKSLIDVYVYIPRTKEGGFTILRSNTIGYSVDTASVTTL